MGNWETALVISRAWWRWFLGVMGNLSVVEWRIIGTVSRVSRSGRNPTLCPEITTKFPG